VTYFADLSSYSYTSGPDVISLDTPPYFRQVDAARPRVNVGRLDHTHRFTAGTVTVEVANALLDVISHQRVNVMRGFHTCPFCPHDPDPEPLRLDHQGRTAWMGNGEIRIPAADGALFAAPTAAMGCVVCWQAASARTVSSMRCGAKSVASQSSRAGSMSRSCTHTCGCLTCSAASGM